MCGICGVIKFNQKESINPEKLRRMTASIANRGPDDEGFFISGSTGMGFRRLSIIDIEGGHQPMSDDDQSVWVIFNGEIYNFKEIKSELENYGHIFKTKSDTEVIVHGYKQWGKEIFNHLNGMFGLAIWDVFRKTLILARDAMGIKFIYYKIDSNKLIFGSEIRPLLAYDGIEKEVDPLGVNLFLRYRYTPSPLTVFKDIKKLAPGTRLIVKNEEVKIDRWWKFTPKPFDPMPTAIEAEEELHGIYLKAVKRHLISDVPVGLLLSGGLDSSLLLALMNHYGKEWQTYTVGYGQDFKDDELDEASEVAKILNANNVQVKLKRETFEETLPEIIKVLEEPVAASSVVPMFYVCKRARQDVKVALMGQGPDELFGGYTRHLGVHYGKYWRKLPFWLRVTGGNILLRLPRKEFLRRGLYSLDTPERMIRYQNVFSIMPGELIDSLFIDGILPIKAGDHVLKLWEDLIPLMKYTDELGGLQFLEIRSSLPDELLMYADKLSMRHGLEVRVPYLDREIVEYVERLSASFKVNNFSRKWLHRKICKSYLPSSILKRKKKGFAVNVVDDWFRKSLSSKMDKIFLKENSLIYQYLKPDKITKLLKDHKDGVQDNHKLLFSLIVLELVLRK